ncbi:MAG: hypothetical protein QW304_07795 [Thermoproteota archaeon]
MSSDVQYQILERLQRLISLLESFIRPAEARPAAAPPTEAPIAPVRRLITAAGPPAPPTPPPTTALEKLLNQLISEGVKTRPYDDHVFTVTEKPITFDGDKLDLGDVYDAVVLMPSVDCQIELDREIQTNTPTVFAFTAFNVEHKVRTIHFKGTSTTVIGTLSIWAFRNRR